MWALRSHREVSVTLVSSTASCPGALFFPQHNLESHFISLLWYYTLFPTEISYSSQQVGTKAERRDSQGHREGCEGWTALWLLPSRGPLCTGGSSIAPLQGSGRGQTVLWDFQILQGWDCMMTRARHLFVTSPLQVLTSKNCLAGNSSFTEPMVLWTSAHHLFFHPLAF